MCGIFFSVARHGYILPSPRTQQLLHHRGPDASQTYQSVIPNPDASSASQLHATYLSTVLSLRGSSLVSQPLRDGSSGSVLCWNGEAWKIGGESVVGNDSGAVFKLLLEATQKTSHDSEPYSHDPVVLAISSITGPFALVFFDAINGTLYYGRDCLGRRSLVKKVSPDDQLILSSICDNDTGDQWTEVEADGIYAVSFRQPTLQTQHHCHRRKGEQPMDEPALVGEFTQSFEVY